MGDRYTLIVKCPKCKLVDEDVWYAPTCGAITWQCPDCKTIVNLEDYTGICAESCANTESGLKEIRKLKKQIEERDKYQKYKEVIKNVKKNQRRSRQHKRFLR